MLAVGDLQFQKKCIGKMEDVARDGRTVLFVSHNMGVAANLCSRCILMEHGRKEMDGAASEVIGEYVKAHALSTGEVTWDEHDMHAGNERMRLRSARTICAGEVTSEVQIDKEVALQFDFAVTKGSLLISSSIHLFDKQGVWVLCSGTNSRILETGIHQHECIFPARFLNDGPYSITIFLLTNATNVEVCIRNAVSFCVHETGVDREEYGGHVGGCIRPSLRWEQASLAGCCSLIRLVLKRDSRIAVRKERVGTYASSGVVMTNSFVP